MQLEFAHGQFITPYAKLRDVINRPYHNCTYSYVVKGSAADISLARKNGANIPGIGHENYIFLCIFNRG